MAAVYSCIILAISQLFVVNGYAFFIAWVEIGFVPLFKKPYLHIFYFFLALYPGRSLNYIQSRKKKISIVVNENHKHAHVCPMF